MTPQQLAEIGSRNLRAKAEYGPAWDSAMSAEKDRDALLAEVQRLDAKIARVDEWANSDVVTAKSSFADGYRECQRDVRDVLKGGVS